MRYIGLAAGLMLLLPVVHAAPPSDREVEVSEDGLVRVPSRHKVGVYRAPGVSFTQYRRIVIEPIPVAFKPEWERRNPNATPELRERMQKQFAQSFREELIEELVERGGYSLAEDVAPDVLRIDASIVDLDYVVPDTESTPGVQTYVRSAGSMKLVIELRDAASGVLIGRVIDYEKAREYEINQQMQRADPVTIAREAEYSFGNAARYTREALNVAKTKRE
jgi:hypothetical protein